jgi:hypothetical protein
MRKRKGGLLKKIEDAFLSDFSIGFLLAVAIMLNVMSGFGMI